MEHSDPQYNLSVDIQARNGIQAAFIAGHLAGYFVNAGAYVDIQHDRSVDGLVHFRFDTDAIGQLLEENRELDARDDGGVPFYVRQLEEKLAEYETAHVSCLQWIGMAEPAARPDLEVGCE